LDVRKTRDGRVLEELGIYDPAHRNPDLRLRLNNERIAHWLSKGAQPSDTVNDLIRKAGIKPTPSA
jgi:small subunit ribosomal protein S16